MRKLLRKLLSRFYRFYALRIIAKDSEFRYGGILVTVPKGIFHPGLFFSTSFLIAELQRISLHGKIFLDLGCGSGLIAIWASKNGANATAIDINPKAVETTKANAQQNHENIEVVQSDLFSALTNRKFDVVAINPPYYRQRHKNDAELAWFAGENLEYFEKLFIQLNEHTHVHSLVLIVVSEDVQWNEIVAIAHRHQISFSLLREKTIWLEKNYLYKIVTTESQNSEN